MSREITFAGVLAGTTVCIHLNGKYSSATLMHEGRTLATAYVDAGADPVEFTQEGRPSVRIGRAYFKIADEESLRLQAWLAEVSA